MHINKHRLLDGCIIYCKACYYQNMSKNEETPNTVQRSLMVIIALLVVGVAWFVWQAGADDKKTADANKETTNSKTAEEAKKAAEQEMKAGDYKGWKTYDWASQGISFKYPGDWFVSETESMGRLYVKNSQVNLNKEETPDNFQQIWFSYDTDETAKAREDAIKKGESDYRVVSGAVTATTIKAGDTTINTYAYETLGGSTLEAYWTNKVGKRFMATTSTEVGKQNQTDMVANLKKVLASVVVK